MKCCGRKSRGPDAQVVVIHLACPLVGLIQLFGLIYLTSGVSIKSAIKAAKEPDAWEDCGLSGPARQAEGFRTLPSMTAATLGLRIVSGEWSHGTMLPTEAELSRDLSVSRSSLREAIKLLAGKGMIRSTPRRGTMVMPRDSWNRLDPDLLVWQVAHGVNDVFVRDLFELRRMIEPQSAALAAERGDLDARRAIEQAVHEMRMAIDTSAEIAADLKFHRTIIERTGNELLAAFLPVIEASLSISFQVSRAEGMEHEHVVPMHRAVSDAIFARDPDAARAAMTALLDRSERDALTGVGLVHNSLKESA